MSLTIRCLIYKWRYLWYVLVLWVKGEHLLMFWSYFFSLVEISSWFNAAFYTEIFFKLQNGNGSFHLVLLRCIGCCFSVALLFWLHSLIIFSTLSLPCWSVTILDPYIFNILCGKLFKLLQSFKNLCLWSPSATVVFMKLNRIRNRIPLNINISWQNGKINGLNSLEAMEVFP